LDFSPEPEDNSEWKGESRVVTLVVTMSLFGREARTKNRFDFL